MINETKDFLSLPLVTVVIPTFNRPVYLEQALRSALAQTYTNLEILIRDNGTDVATGGLLAGIKDDRIKYLRHPKNVGMTNNVLGAFREAEGKYVTNLHDDDFWAPNFIEKMVAVLEDNPSTCLAFCDHYIVNEKGEVEESRTELNLTLFGRKKLSPGLHQPFLKLALVQMGIPMAMAAIVRRDSIDWDDFPNLSCAYDFWLVYLACREGKACYYVPEKLTYYRIHTASESTMGRVRLNKGFIEIYEGMMHDRRVGEFREIFRKRLAVHHTEAAVAFLRQGERETAREMLRKGAKYRRDIKSGIAYAASFLPPAISERLPGKLRFSCLPPFVTLLAFATS